MVQRLLSKSVVLYSSSVYLEVFPVDCPLPAHSEMIFPISLQEENYFFYFHVGQMAGPTPDEADFEPLTEVAISEFPDTPDGLLDVYVIMDVDDDGSLYVRVEYSPPDSRDVVLAVLEPFGPFMVD